MEETFRDFLVNSPFAAHRDARASSMSCQAGRAMAVVSCRVGSGRTASASSGRTSRVRSDASVSGRNGSHVFGARGRSAVRYVYPPQRWSDSVHHVLCVSRHKLFGLFVLGAAIATKTNQNQIQHRSTYLPSNPASGRDRVSLATNTASPPRYPIHFFPNRPTRCAAVRSSSPSKRGDKFELSSGGKEGRGKTVSTAAVSPPDAEIGGACATTRTPHPFLRRRAFIRERVSKKTTLAAQVEAPAERNRRCIHRGRAEHSTRTSWPRKHRETRSMPTRLPPTTQSLTVLPLHHSRVQIDPVFSPVSPSETRNIPLHFFCRKQTLADFEFGSIDESLLNLGDLSDELSAKVAQMQALLAEETSNMGNQLTQLDKDVLQRLEESYASSDSEDEDDDGKRVARHAKKASATATVTKKMKVMKKPRKDDDNFSSDTAPVTGITTGDGPPKRGRPKGSLNKAKSGALNASVATNTTTRAREHRPDVANVPGSVPGSTVGTVLPQTTRAGNVVRRGPRGKSGGKATDSMKTYLKDIGTVSLLNSAQEVELAKRIQDLVYLDGVRETVTDELGKDPSVFEWACAANVTVGELETRLEEGKRAKNLMIQANLRLVVSIAKRYANKSMSFQDLIQEGCVGLIRGAEKFDFKRGYKFSTYAHWW